MKLLSKAQETARAVLLDDLRKAKSDVESAVVEVNRVVNEKLTAAITRYNDALAAVDELRDEVVAEMDEYYKSRSHAWRIGEVGGDYNRWMTAWQGLDLTETEGPPELAAPDMDHDNDFEALPSEPDGSLT